MLHFHSSKASTNLLKAFCTYIIPRLTQLEYREVLNLTSKKENSVFKQFLTTPNTQVGKFKKEEM